MLSEAGQAFYLYTLEQFSAHSSEYLRTPEISDSTRTEIREKLSALISTNELQEIVSKITAPPDYLASARAAFLKGLIPFTSGERVKLKHQPELQGVIETAVSSDSPGGLGGASLVTYFVRGDDGKVYKVDPADLDRVEDS